ncbi:DNA helicase [Tanacetum coccineum]|uniref:ATP-dependent DNA helicase n=1 Tax=Tanacetum coccineum TaxID=301880 RepID=A0ABQ5ATZ3_9ASTR
MFAMTSFGAKISLPGRRVGESEINPKIVQGLIHVLDEHNGLVREIVSGVTAGSKIILPRTSTGGPRYMYSHYLDALTICRSLGNQQFFITFTCNVKWPEIKRYMAQYPELTPADRADVICRVFEQNVKDFLSFLKEVKTFGDVSAVLFTIEFQKRGPNRILIKISNSDESTMMKGNRPHIDEIQNYVDGRFVCPYEACWRIFDFLIHSREPAVQILNVHLENMQRVNFCESDRLDIIVNLPEKKKMTLTEWFVYNNEKTDGRHLTYLDFPLEFVGCKSPIEVRTVNGQILPTYRAACEALGLLGDDKEWDIELEESTISATSKELRKIIVLGDDFRQTLPVKKGASKDELIAASIAKSHLWPYFKVCTLKENMWLLRSGLTSKQQRHSEQFARWLLDVGNGEIGEPDSENEQDSYWVTISPEYTVIADEAGMSELIDFIYDDTTLKAPTAGSL